MNVLNFWEKLLAVCCGAILSFTVAWIIFALCMVPITRGWRIEALGGLETEYKLCIATHPSEMANALNCNNLKDLHLAILQKQWWW